MATNKIATQIRIDETTYRKAKYIAEKKFRSSNNQLEYFILKGVEQYEKEHGVILLEPEE